MDSTLSDPIQGTPEVLAKGQGGLLDVALDPEFENNNFIYLSFSEPGTNNTASTALGRGKFSKSLILKLFLLKFQKSKDPIILDLELFFMKVISISQQENVLNLIQLKI